MMEWLVRSQRGSGQGGWDYDQKIEFVSSRISHKEPTRAQANPKSSPQKFQKNPT